MDDIKREKLEKACKKIHKVRTRMVAVRMVRVRNMPVEETVNLYSDAQKFLSRHPNQPKSL